MSAPTMSGLQMRAGRPVTRCAVALIAAVAMLLPACANTDSTLQVGVKRSAVDLAFTDETLEAPEPNVVIRRIEQIAPVPPIEVELPRRTPPPPTPTPDPGICPSAPPNAIIDVGVVETIENAPQEGVYTYFAEGSVTIEAPGGQVEELEVAQLSTREVRNVQTDVDAYQASGYQTGEVDQQAIQYEVHQRVGRTTIIATYQVRDVGVGLMELKRVTDGAEMTFAPGPNAGTHWGGDTLRDNRHTGFSAIHRHTAPGRPWRVEAMDSESRMALVLDGEIAQREVIDMCGDIIDTYRTETHEEMADLDGEYLMRTIDDEPNVRNFATHVGPIPVAEEFNYTEEIAVTNEQGDRVPVKITWRYATTLMSLDPEPLPS